MRHCAPWLVLGCVAVSTACGLSTIGLDADPGSGDEPDGEVDATSSAEGSVARDDAAHPADGSMPRDGDGGIGPGSNDALADGTSANEAGAKGEGGANAVDAGEGGASSFSDGGCDGSAGCVVVPSGWTLVAFAPNQSTGCPSGFESPANLVEGPDTSGACTCGSCTVTGQPSCASGAVDIFYDDVATSEGAGTCALPGMTPSLTNDPAGSCGNVANGGGVYAGNYALFDIKYVSPPVSGGTCSVPGAATGSVTYSALDRACVASSPQSANCVGGACAPSLEAPYSACIMQSGSVACPAGPLGVQHLAGSGVSFGCSTCGCSVSGTCTGTITLYSDTKCADIGVKIPADGMCRRVSSLPDSADTYTFESYTYDGGAPGSVSCSASGSSSAESVALAEPVTICCSQ
jgi:hypothetical protein